MSRSNGASVRAGVVWRGPDLEHLGTLSSELAPHAERLMPHPRIYVDANVPAGLVAYMRERLKWDVLFVLEEDQLRRAADVRHFQVAGQLRRTLVTLDRDYLDDRRFPPADTAGVLVMSAPSERAFSDLLDRLDRLVFRHADDPGQAPASLPLEGRKLHVHTDWGREG